MSASDEGPSEASSSAAEDKDEKPEENGEDEESSESSSSSDSNETASVPPLSDNEERQAPLEEIEVSSDSESDEESDSRPAKGGKRGAKANGKAAQKPKPAARAKKPKLKKGKQVVLVPDPSDLVEKFLAARTNDGKREFLVKHKHTSYHHLTWLPEEVLVEMQMHNKGRIQRWVEAYGEPEPKSDDVADTDFFLPSYLLVDRVVAARKKNKEYLIKWRDLHYSDCTWETLEFLQDLPNWKEKLEDFQKRAKPAVVKRPKQIHFDSKLPPPAFPGGRELRSYQVEGFRWLAYSWIKGNKGILADEMGLGKTIQSISVLQWLMNIGHIGPFIIVAPLSTLGQWQREIESWSDLNAVIYHGDAHTREIIHEYEWSFPNSQQVKFNVLVTSYEMLLQESTRLAKVTWKYMILDEGHRIKNTQAKVLVALEKFTAEHKLILTGTPLQNNMSELWSMLNFLEPEKFANRPEFLESFGNLQDAAQLGELQKMLAPHFLRRLKEDVEKDLPVKEEIIIMVDMTSIQKAFYKAVLERNGDFLRRGSGVRAKLLNICMELRKVCNHPFLLTGAEAQLTEGKGKNAAHEMLASASSKMIFLDKLLRKLKDENHKVLIFSQMTRQLDILEDYVATRGFEYERLDGSHSQAQREHSLRQFRKGNTFVFLLSTRAGGVGLNLTTADTVIIYDSDWNPQNDLQAQARCHRIGQTVPVTIYRLLTQDSYEKHMFDIASKKLGLASAVLGKRETSEVVDGTDGPKELDAKELNQLLRFGAYQLFNTDTNTAQATDKRIMDESLDSILARASRVQYLDAGGHGDGPKVSFAKAAFDEVAADVKMDDEAFWDKILPEFKSTRRFLTKLENAAEMKEEEKTQLMEAIPELVAEVKKSSANRNFWASFDPMQDLAQLLATIAGSSAFSADQRAAARNQQEELLSSRRRHGRPAPRQLELAAPQPDAAPAVAAEPIDVDMSPPEVQSSADPYVAPREQVKRKRNVEGLSKEERARAKEEKKKQKELKKLWNKHKRATFRSLILVVGWGRWERINELGDFKKTPHALRSFGEAWLCTPGFESELYAVLKDTKREVLEAAAAMDAIEGPMDAEIALQVKPALLPDEEFVLRVESPGSATPCPLEKPLAAVLFYCAKPDESYPVRVLPVHALNQNITVSAPGFVGRYVARLVAGKKTYSYSDDAPFLVERPESLIEEQPPKHGQLHRLQTMRLVNRFAAVYGPEFHGLPSEHVAPRGSGPALWWSDEFDRRLLASVYAKGIRFYDVHLDPTSGLDDLSIESYLGRVGAPVPTRPTAPVAADGKALPVRLLPISHKLATRLDRLLAALELFATTTKRRDTSTPGVPSAPPAAAKPAPVPHSLPPSHAHAHAHASAAAPVAAPKRGTSPERSSADAKKAKPAPPSVAPPEPPSLVQQLAQKALASTVPMKPRAQAASTATNSTYQLATPTAVKPAAPAVASTHTASPLPAAPPAAAPARPVVATSWKPPTEPAKPVTSLLPRPHSAAPPVPSSAPAPSTASSLPSAPPTHATPAPLPPGLRAPQGSGLRLNNTVTAAAAPAPAPSSVPPPVIVVDLSSDEEPPPPPPKRTVPPPGKPVGTSNIKLHLPADSE